MRDVPAGLPAGRMLARQRQPARRCGAVHEGGGGFGVAEFRDALMSPVPLVKPCVIWGRGFTAGCPGPCAGLAGRPRPPSDRPRQTPPSATPAGAPERERATDSAPRGCGPGAAPTATGRTAASAAAAGALRLAPRHDGGRRVRRSGRRCGRTCGGGAGFGSRRGCTTSAAASGTGRTASCAPVAGAAPPRSSADNEPGDPLEFAFVRVRPRILVRGVTALK